MEKILSKQNSAKEILAKCKLGKTEDESLRFTELTRDMFKDNKIILDKYFRNEKGHDCYYANLLAFQSVKKELSLKDLKSILKRDFGKLVSLAGYRYNPEHYKFNNLYMQEEYEEDLFKDVSNEQEELELEADRRAIIECLDFDAVETLYKVLFKAIKQRYIIILNLESVPGILNNAIDCYMKNISCGPSNYAMHSKIAEIRKILENPDVIEWLNTGASDMSLDREDYIYTYQKVLRQITDIKNEPLNYVKDILHNEYDLFEDEILSNEQIEFVQIINNQDSDEYED